MKVDQVENFGVSTIQHGPANDRVYLMKLGKPDFPQVISYVNGLALLHDYSKVFAKVPSYAREAFAENGYRVEAEIPRFYAGKEDVYFMARYFHPDRLVDHAADRVRDVLNAAEEKQGLGGAVSLKADFSVRLAREDDCEQMAELYRQVFASYPFPIDDRDYLARTMAENVIYAGIWKGEQLLALASAEIDQLGQNAEMTDFATHPEWQGHGFAHALLKRLEQELSERDVSLCYTIARATSFGMNCVFARHGYQHSGTLVKNTQISGGLESMNVWFKPLTGSR